MSIAIDSSPALELDPAIVEALLPDEDVTSVEHYITSSWAWTLRVSTKAADGSLPVYFVKILASHDASDRVLGEYMAMKEIYDTLPTIAPKPHGFGKCRQRDAYFFLCDYLSIKHNLPDPERLGAKLAELHHKSVSPTGMFGFHCPTFDGKLPLNTDWDPNWTSFFKKLMRGVYQLDVEVNGFWKELDDVMQITLDKLIPRLLDPLASNDRSIKPSLIHGDLWESNIGTLEDIGEIYIFDACAYYAHHEKEAGIWRCKHHKMNDEEYRTQYFKVFPPSDPVGEADDRNRLYSVETLIINSAHFPGAETRGLAVEELRYLINKFVPMSDVLEEAN